MTSDDERKRKIREWQADHDCERLRLVPRELRTNWNWPGLGKKSFGLLEIPPAEPITAWDVRERDGELGLFISRSDVAHQNGERRLLGYRHVETGALPLAAWLGRLHAIRVPLWPGDDQAGPDGTSYEIDFAPGFCRHVRLAWWDEGPPAWRELTSLVDEMLRAFRPLAG